MTLNTEFTRVTVVNNNSNKVQLLYCIQTIKYGSYDAIKNDEFSIISNSVKNLSNNY